MFENTNNFVLCFYLSVPISEYLNLRICRNIWAGY